MLNKEDALCYNHWHSELHEWKVSLLHAHWIYEHTKRIEFKRAIEFAERKCKNCLEMLRLLRK